MAVAAGGGRDYPEPVISWLSISRLRFLLIVLVLSAFYSVSWRLAHVEPAKLLSGLPKMAGWAVKAWPPALDELPVLLQRTAETIAMAALGTTVTAALATSGPRSLGTTARFSPFSSKSRSAPSFSSSARHARVNWRC